MSEIPSKGKISGEKMFQLMMARSILKLDYNEIYVYLYLTSYTTLPFHERPIIWIFMPFASHHNLKGPNINERKKKRDSIYLGNITKDNKSNNLFGQCN